MGKLIYEVIPCNSFKNRCIRTKEAINKGYKVEHIGNDIISIYYNIKS